MKRTFAILAAALLVTSLIAPSAAVAAKGGEPRGSGNGRSAAPGQVKKNSEDSAVETPGEVATPTAPDESSDEPAKGKGNGNGVAAGEPNHDADAHASENGTSTARFRTHVRLRESEEGSDTAKPMRTGIENALDHISANLDRANIKINEGTRKSLPPGLVRVFEKFLGWLGLESDDAPEDDAITEQPTDAPDTSDEDTATPAPDSDAVTSTPTPEPEAE